MIYRILFGLFWCFFLWGCEQKITADIELKPVDFSALSGWKEDNLSDFMSAFKYSCSAILNKKEQWLSPTAEIKVSTTDLQRICTDFSDKDFVSPSDFKRFIENNFYPAAVFAKGNQEGVFTSYYEAEIYASFAPSDKYKYPLYGKPKDLIEFNIAD